MAGPHPARGPGCCWQPCWCQLPGDMGESDTPLQHLLGGASASQGPALKVSGVWGEAVTQCLAQTLTQPFSKQPPPTSRVVEL